MTKKIISILLLSVLFVGYVSAKTPQQTSINKDLEVMQLTPDCYLYTAWDHIEGWGRVGSNGLVVISDGKALLIDTPTSKAQTATLVDWFNKNLSVRFESFVPGHWHSDCVGGMAWLNEKGVKSYANRMTNDILAAKGREQAQESFTDSLRLAVGKIDVELYYLGGGHATDNIVVWIPSQKVLFGGCMIKDIDANGIGNTSDAAPLDEWMQTVERVNKKFPDAEYVIPGHGKSGGKELFSRTTEIIEEAQRSHKK